MPAALEALRSPDDFLRRIRRHRAQILVTGPVGAPTGFLRINGDELDQFYVAPDRIGSGFAARLMAAAEARMAAAGVRDAWLACTVGNTRAARFYARAGWVDAGVRPLAVETAEGPFTLSVWRFEKRLAGVAFAGRAMRRA